MGGSLIHWMVDLSIQQASSQETGKDINILSTNKWNNNISGRNSWPFSYYKEIKEYNIIIGEVWGVNANAVDKMDLKNWVQIIDGTLFVFHFTLFSLRKEQVERK